MPFDHQTTMYMVLIIVGLLIIFGIMFGWHRRPLRWLSSLLLNWVPSVFLVPELIRKYGMQEKRAKRIVMILGIAQIALILCGAILEGQAMHFCDPKGDYCVQTELYFRYKAFSTSFFKLWLASIVAVPITAIFCP